MKYYRNEVVAQMEKWIGCKQGDATHKEIIDIYNSKRPGYKMTYSDAWCAATVSAVAIALGYEDIIPLECSCNRMIKLAMNKGIWMEDDAYVPNPGDILMYAWNDDGKGDCTIQANHVGYVKSVIDGSMYIMEGNMGDDHICGVRRFKVNSRYIRGYILPKYTGYSASEETHIPSEKTEETKVTYTVQKGDNLSRIASRMRDGGYEVTWKEIAQINGIKSPYYIYPGQILTIRK